MLKKVKVDGPLYVVGSGRVELSAAQAKTRAHNLKAVLVGQDGAGEYEVVNPVQFKRGEEFGFDGKVGKDGVLTAAEPEAEVAAENFPDGLVKFAGSNSPSDLKSTSAKKLSAATRAVKGIFGK